MALLQNYLSAVKVYLPHSADQQDILTEIREHLQIKLDERIEELGRSLTESEEAAVLASYGDPLIVAARYGSTNLGLSFGRQLIGPETFIIYRWVLFTQFSLTLIVVSLINWLGNSTGSPLGRYLWPMSLQFALTTSIFIAIDLFKRRSQTRDAWHFPPPYMQSVPRWQSVAGFVVLSLVALWWAAIPYAPFLLLGDAAERVTLTPGWQGFYWPALIPLVAGAIQRLITFVEPRWSAFQAVTRLLTNTWAVWLAVQFLSAYPYVTPAVEGAEAIALRINNGFWWNAAASFGLYWLIQAAFLAFMCAKHFGHFLRRRRDQALLESAR